MILGDLTKVLEGDETIYESVQNIQMQQFGNAKKPGKISEILTKLSHYGMSYSEDVFKNMQAVPANKNYINKNDLVEQSLYNMGGNVWRLKGDEEKSFRDKTLDQKRQVLRKIAMEPEIEDILDMMANECIVYDDEETYIAEPYIDTNVLQLLKEKSAEEIRNSVNTNFLKIYTLLNWKREAWNTFKRYLIDGVLAYEIVYDDLENPKSIIGIIELDPATLTRKVVNGVDTWIQYEGIQGQERHFIDAQIIYIKYEDSGVIDRTSYVERLIRPFNIYRIIEQAQLIWTVTQSSFKMMFTIPVNGMNKAKGAQTLNAAMNRYKEDISFNNETGELRMNGKVNQPFNKEYWMAENENGKPTIETLSDGGPVLNDSEQLKYYLGKLYKISKIPENRFDKEAQSTWFGSDPTQQLRDEINFSRFVSRIRSVYSEIILKPLRIQISLSIPDIKNDKRILDAINLRFNSYNQFEELMGIEIDSKRIEFISNMSQSLTITDKDGNEAPYFSMKFLILKYLKMSDADLEFNQKCLLEDKIQAGDMEEDEENEEGGDEEENEDILGGEEGGEEESEGEENEEESDEGEGASLDSEMLGDVQPESSETTQA